MRIVSRYLLAQFAASSATVLALLCITWISADALLHIDSFGENPRDALRTTIVGALEFVPLAVPLACLVGVVWSITRAVRNLEITAIRCGGIPLRTALVPLLIGCVLLGGLVTVAEDRLIVPAREALHAREAGSIGLLDRPRHWNGRWWFSTGSSVFSTEQYEDAPFSLLSVTVFEFDAASVLRRRVDAARAHHVSGETWEFEDLTVRSFEGSTGLRAQAQERLQIDLGVTGDELARAVPKPSAISLNQLARRIRDSARGAASRAALETAFHERIARALTVLLLVLLAIPIAIGDTERGDSLARSLLQAVAVSGLFFLLWTLALFAAQSGVVPPALPIWGVMLGCLGFGAWRFRRIAE